MAHQQPPPREPFDPSDPTTPTPASHWAAHASGPVPHAQGGPSSPGVPETAGSAGESPVWNPDVGLHATAPLTAIEQLRARAAAAREVDQHGALHQGPPGQYAAPGEGQPGGGQPGGGHPGGAFPGADWSGAEQGPGSGSSGAGQGPGSHWGGAASAGAHTPGASTSLTSPRAPKARRGLRRSPSRVVRDTLAGMFLADTVVGPVVEWTTRAQRPLTTGRRIVVLGSHRHSGVTTTATTLALLLSHIRREKIALVGTGDDPTPIVARTGCPSRLPADRVLSAIESGRAGDTDGITHLMDRIAANAWAIAYQENAGGHAVGKLTRNFTEHFGATVIDAGAVPSGATLALLGSADAVVLVGDASREGMNAIEVAFTHLLATRQATPDRLVITLAQTQRGNRTDLAWEAGVARKQGIRSVGIPWEEQLAANSMIRTDLLEQATLRAFTRLMAESIDTSMTVGITCAGAVGGAAGTGVAGGMAGTGAVGGANGTVGVGR